MIKRTTRGIGYNSGGTYTTTESGKLTHAYITWSDMFRRCYDTKYHQRKPSYKGCTVDAAWHDYQVFAEWYYKHPLYGLGYELDKDIKVLGNTVYSPELCTLVPKQINMAVLCTTRKKLPNGVVRNNNSYTAKISRYGLGNKYLGTFTTIEAAYACYKVAKEQYVHDLATQFKDKLEVSVYHALLKWKLQEVVYGIT